MSLYSIKVKSHRKVTKSNKLVNAKEEKQLSPLSQKIFLACAVAVKNKFHGRVNIKTEIDESIEQEDLDGGHIENLILEEKKSDALPKDAIHLHEKVKSITLNFVDIFGSKLTYANYRDIRSACKALSTAAIAFEEFDDEGNWIRGKYRPLFSEIDADSNSGKLNFILNVLIFDELVDVGSNFTQYYIDNVFSFTSSFSMRIYEFLMQGKNKYRSRKFTVNQLLEVLSLEKKARYKNFSNLRVTVLDKACLEISEKSDITVEWKEAEKQGKKVTAVEFKWEYKKEESSNNNSEKKEASKLEENPNYEKIMGMRKLGLDDESIKRALNLKHLPGDVIAIPVIEMKEEKQRDTPSHVEESEAQVVKQTELLFDDLSYYSDSATERIRAKLAGKHLENYNLCIHNLYNNPKGHKTPELVKKFNRHIYNSEDISRTISYVIQNETGDFSRYKLIQYLSDY